LSQARRDFGNGILDQISYALAVTFHWVTAALASALFMGAYELCTKQAVRGNAVVPVLFWSTFTNAAIWGALLTADGVRPACLPASLTTASISAVGQLQLA